MRFFTLLTSLLCAVILTSCFPPASNVMTIKESDIEEPVSRVILVVNGPEHVLFSIDKLQSKIAKNLERNGVGVVIYEERTLTLEKKPLRSAALKNGCKYILAVNVNDLDFYNKRLSTLAGQSILFNSYDLQVVWRGDISVNGVLHTSPMQMRRRFVKDISRSLRSDQMIE